MDKKEIIQEFLDWLSTRNLKIAKVTSADHFNEGSTLTVVNSYKTLDFYLLDKDLK